MSDEIKHECAVALVVLRQKGEYYREKYGTGDYGGMKLSLLLEKQHNRGQDGAGAAILSNCPETGSQPYWLFKSASSTALADLLGAIAKRDQNVEGGGRAEPWSSDDTPYSRIFLGHLRYATFGKNNVAFCHPFIHQASELCHTLLLAGNFNLTNAAELFDDYRQHGSFPTSKADGYLICELIAKEVSGMPPWTVARPTEKDAPPPPLAAAIANALKDADGAWTLVGATAEGAAFATRDPQGIRPGWYYIDDEVVAVASERPAIQAAFDVPPEAVKELPCGETLLIAPSGEISHHPPTPPPNHLTAIPPNHPTTQPPLPPSPRPCSFEHIYFSRANDADIHRERKALGAALLPQILKAADAPLEDIFFSYIPNSARIAFHGLLEEIFKQFLAQQRNVAGEDSPAASPCLRVDKIPRFGEIAVKDAKFRTFIADAAARREFYKHVYDVTYGLVRPGGDTLVVLDDSIVRGNTMKNAILPMLDRLGPKRIVVASSAPPIRYPDCYGIDMSTLGELVAFKALVNLLGDEANTALTKAAMASDEANPLAPLYARFTEAQHAVEIARLLTPPDMKAELVVVYQTVEALHQCLLPASAQLAAAHAPLPTGDWYFTGDYPTRGGYKVLHKALANYLARSTDRSY